MCFISLREGRSNWFFKFRVEIGQLAIIYHPRDGGGKEGGRSRGERGSEFFCCVTMKFT